MPASDLLSSLTIESLESPVNRTPRPKEEVLMVPANSDWPYKCYLAMLEPIVDRAVRLMKDEELWQ
jgi:hypothetical protein